MLKRITQTAADLADLLGIEGKIFLRLVSRSAGLAALLLVVAFVAAVAVLGLSAAAVVALSPQLGVAGSLALMSGVVLLACVLLGISIWSMLLSVHRQEKLDRTEQRLAAERSAAIAKLRNPEPEPSPPSPFAALAGIDFSKINPTLVVAAVGAAAAVVGPMRLLKIAGGLAGNLALVSSLVSAGKSALHGAMGQTKPQPGTTNGVPRG